MGAFRRHIQPFLSSITLATTRHPTRAPRTCQRAPTVKQATTPAPHCPHTPSKPCEPTFAGLFCLLSLWQQHGAPPTPLAHANVLQRRSKQARPLPRTHMHPLSPVNQRLQGFYVSYRSGHNTCVTHNPRIHLVPTQPRQPPPFLPVPPTHSPPPWKSQKSASMSWQHRRCALSASDDVAGTWQHFRATSTSVAGSYDTPLCGPINPITPGARQPLEHAIGQEPHHWFLPFATPHCCGATWNKQRGSKRPLCCNVSAKKSGNDASVVRERFGASWRRCWRSGANLHPISHAPTPRESTETPWQVSDG
jgi:hypothetical protein